ncbi:alcohol oxidase-like protein [Lactarius deliciosus]|nr:alcohol oxidase-like protein [Lactarius deliciosus]
MSCLTAINEEYDIVIAGGGTAACVIASRLAVADASLRVLLLEAGPTTYNNPAHTQPLRSSGHLASGSRTVRAHISRPSAALGGRAIMVPCGQCLGGGGSVNFMVYARPSASDYDNWETVYQNPGWGSKDLTPLLRKTETYQVPGGGPTHGTDGPLAVSLGGFLTDLAQQFLRAARTLDPDRAQKPDDADLNDLETINVGGPSAYMIPSRRFPNSKSSDFIFLGSRWINDETGTRSDVPHNMIYPLKDTRPNLHFLTGVHVKHVTFDDENRATGVAYVLNPLFHSGGLGDTRTVQGTKLVLVSAGTFGSPGILERSGIGAKGVLDRVGVKQRVDLPGVGENYQDHNTFGLKYFAADEAQSLDAVFRNEEGAIDAAAAEFGKTKKEISMQNPLDAGIKWRPKPSEVTELGPEFQEYWDSYFVNAPDKPVLRIGMFSALFGNPTAVPPRKYFTLAIYTEYPLARGHVHITHAGDVSAPVDFVPGFFESSVPLPSRPPIQPSHDFSTRKADVQPLMWGYKFAREIARRMPHFRGEPPVLHPAFAPGSPASIVAHADGPVPFDTPRIEYLEEDERALEAFARANVGTCWHSVSPSLPYKVRSVVDDPREQGGVVDPRLNVYGVRGLKVADLSVPPSNVSANTYGTALVIGEKAAIIIAEEFGIKGVV